MPLLRDRIERLTNRANRNVWGVRLIYTPNDGAPVSETPDGEPLVGVFDSAYLSVELVDGVEIADRRPMLDISLADLGFVPAEGDKFTIQEAPHSGETYTVVSVNFDSAQSTKLMLVKGNHSD